MNINKVMNAARDGTVGGLASPVFGSGDAGVMDTRLPARKRREKPPDFDLPGLVS